MEKREQPSKASLDPAKIQSKTSASSTKGVIFCPNFNGSA
jgi:hypothetical protein